jgi:acetyl esterase/lipase
MAGAMALGGCATVGASRTSVETVRLWPGEPPGGEGVTAQEEIIERSRDPARPDRAVVHVRTPTLKIFRPWRADGSAVLVMPGGAYQRVVLDKEGDETALRLAQAGVTAAVLVYRLPGDGWASGADAPREDARQAMTMLRGMPGVRRVGALGFSAGGHLAARLALESEGAERPDFVGLIYAAYLDGEGSAALGAGPDLISEVSRQAPPMFLLHAADDATVPVNLSIRMFEALQAAGVASELHVFPVGGHGFGIARAADKPVSVWPDLFLRWGRARGVFGG